MPDVVSALSELDAGRFGFAFGFIEKAKLNAFRVVGVNGEVNAVAIPVGAKGKGIARINSHA
jgi:hypothetical protein